MAVYGFYPPLLEWAGFPLPVWVRSLGAALSAGCLLLIWWVQWALDVQFDTTLHQQADHRLVTHGPYRWVRHPMYTTLFLMGLGWLFLTANAFVGGGLIAGILLVVSTRVEKEEAMLLEIFGEEYRGYQNHTGKFLPRFRRKADDRF